MQIQILNSKEIKKLAEQIKKQFDANLDLNYVFIKNKDRIFIINKDISKLDFSKVRINSLGLYLGTLEKDGFRASIEGSQLLGKTAKKNIIEVNPEDWLKAKEIKIKHENAYVLVKNNKDFLGCGKIKNNILLNYVPKERRLNIDSKL